MTPIQVVLTMKSIAFLITTSLLTLALVARFFYNLGQKHVKIVDIDAQIKLNFLKNRLEQIQDGVRKATQMAIMNLLSDGRNHDCTDLIRIQHAAGIELHGSRAPQKV